MQFILLCQSFRVSNGAAFDRTGFWICIVTQQLSMTQPFQLHTKQSEKEVWKKKKNRQQYERGGKQRRHGAGRRLVCVDRLGIATSSSCPNLAAHKKKKKFSSCCLCSYLSCLSYLQKGSREEWRCLRSCTQQMGFWLWTAALFTKECRCGRSGKKKKTPCPKVSTQPCSLLMPPTHMCTFCVFVRLCESSKQELARGNGFLWLRC